MLAVSAQAGNTSAQENSGNPLHEAAERGDKAKVEALLDSGADINAKDEREYTPLHSSVFKAKKDIVELLLARGADVNARGVYSHGYTPLHAAAFSGLRDIAELLLGKGANINARTESGYTALFLAVNNDRRAVLELLLAKGADVVVQNNEGDTVLHDWAGINGNFKTSAGVNYSEEMLGLLLANGNYVNATNKEGYTPLHKAVFYRRKNIVELLLAKGAQINIKNKFGITPLDVATNQGFKDLAELLLAKAVDANVKDKDGNTAQGLANFAVFSRSTYEPVWTRNSRRALELSYQAEQLAKAGDRLGSWRAMTEAVQLSPNDPLLLRDFCHSSFDVGRYRDVVWGAQTLVEKFREDRWLFGGAAMHYEWGISLAVLGEYEQAAQVLGTGVERFPSGEWGDGFREWSIVLTYLNKDFIAAREEARAHPVTALGGSVHNGTVWNLLVKRIQDLSGMADMHKMQYPLLDHLSQLHRLIRDGIEKSYLSFETPEFKTKLGKFSRDLAWRTIIIYQSLPVKPLPPAVAVEKARRALNVIATEPEYNWERAIQDLMDVTRRVPWWAEAHYNVAVLFENRTFGGNWGDYYDYSDFVRSGSPSNRTIAAQEYMFCVGADPHGSKAAAARKMLKEWDQPIPN
jgi:ankyrin repeat protein